MQLTSRAWGGLTLLAVLFLLKAGALGQGVLTVQVGSPVSPPAPLVRHGDDWSYRKGTSEPQADWKTAPDAGLDPAWLIGPGGFGYADEDDATVLDDMLNGYNTVYIRRTFEIPVGTDPTRRLQLVMDWDDGFVAYLDGIEVQRSPNVALTDPEFDSATVAGQNHEAFAGAGGNPPTTYDLGPVSSFGVGTHVLAIHGLNAAPNSSDFSLIADLTLIGGGQGVAGGGALFAIVNSTNVLLSGTNTIPGSTRVTVNGEETAFNSATGEWSRNHALAPDLNELFIVAHDSAGDILASTNRDVLSQTTTIAVGGVLASDTIWDGANGTYRVTSSVIVPAGVELRVTNGAVVLLAPGTSVRATTNGTVTVRGSESSPILFAPANGATAWGDLGAFGTNATLHLSYAEVVAGQIRPVNGGEVMMEDSVIRDFEDPRTEVISGENGGSLTMRRCYGARFGEMDASETPVLIEDSLLEHFFLDGLDIKGTNVPLVVRRSTLRFGSVTNGNADGIDFGPGAGFVDRCLIHDFPDKGISLGGAPGTRMQETVIYNCGSGINVNVSTNCSIANVTISSCATGLFFRTAGASLSDLSGSNNIVWGNTENVIFTGNSTLRLTYSDVQGGQPGEGNIDADPLFVDEGAKDFRLSPGSPALGTGLGGVDMGALFPVGGLPAVPRNLAALVEGTNAIQLVWQDDSENETMFQLERREGSSGEWTPHAIFGPNVTSYTDVTALLNQRYYYRVRSVNASGSSRFSNIASATRQEPVLIVGGTLAANTTWSPTMGTIIVVSNLIVPVNVTLTMLPGTRVQLTNGASIRAVAGGAINIAGTAENNVTLQGVDGANTWAEISAQFAGSSITIRHADISLRQTTVMSNAVALFEDSFFHHYRLANPPAPITFSRPIMLARFPQLATVRRCHFREYYETLFRDGVMVIEDSLFEFISGDGLDFDGAKPGSALRRCTFRHGNLSNVDAVDVGPGESGGCVDLVIEDCVMFDFPFDKGVSVGDAGASRGTVVRNCLIYDCLSGIMAKASCDVTVSHCTIVDNDWGFTNYNNSGSAQYTGGHTTNFNSILWNNTTTLSLRDDGTLTSDHSVLSNTNWPGDGQLDADPLFVNAAQRDYRLQSGSPCLGTGRGGADMGAHFPVGAPMALSHPRIERFDVTGGQAVVRFWADDERTYSVLCSDRATGGSWLKAGDVPMGTVPRFLSITNLVAPENRFYRLVTPQAP